MPTFFCKLYFHFLRIPNSTSLISREQLDALPKDATDLSFGNSVYNIRFDQREERPVFGHKYWFYLKDAVENVPEYIVMWDNFVRQVFNLNNPICPSHLVISAWRKSTIFIWYIKKSSTRSSVNTKIIPNSDPSWCT